VPEPGRDIHRSATLLLSAVMAALGVVIVIRTIAFGGGPVSLGVLFGVLFAVAGAGRFYVTWRRL
jgi:ABC-type Mn2+/Zn2+ transport system permease subunit